MPTKFKEGDKVRVRKDSEHYISYKNKDLTIAWVDMQGESRPIDYINKVEGSLQFRDVDLEFKVALLHPTMKLKH